MQEAGLSLIGQNKAQDLNGGPFAGFRNKIIGGDFSTNPWQRGTSFPGLATLTYTADRWRFVNTSASVWTIAKDATSNPSIVDTKRLVTDNLLMVCTTADATVAAGDAVLKQQFIEGYNFLPLAQRSMVLTFWHQHVKTGTYCVAFRNSLSDRSFVAEYTQVVANRWEFTKIVIPPSPSAGSWNYTNGVGIDVTFTVMAGTTFQTTPGIWQTGNFFATANQVNGADAVNNTFKFALIQLEPGVFPTPFEDRTFGMELALCQRYFQRLGFDGGGRWYGGRTESTSVAMASQTLPVVLRTGPGITAANLGAIVVNDGSVQTAVTSIGSNFSSNQMMSITLNTAAVLTINRPIFWAVPDANTGFFISAEF